MSTDDRRFGVRSSFSDGLKLRALNPKLPGADVSHKDIVLDVLAELHDGRLVDVEMQMWRRSGELLRALMFLARIFAAGLGRGDPYTQIAPVVGVHLLSEPWLPGERFHSIFQVREMHDHQIFSEALELNRRRRFDVLGPGNQGSVSTTRHLDAGAPRSHEDSHPVRAAQLRPLPRGPQSG